MSIPKNRGSVSLATVYNTLLDVDDRHGRTKERKTRNCRITL